MKDVMIDIETLGNGKNACVVQIGACYFNRTTGEIGETFKRNISAQSAVKSGAEIDADTVLWWLKQSKDAVASITAEPQEPITDVFNALNDFLSNAKNIWSHATFDFVIIQETYKRLGIKMKFRYSAARDIRTLVDLANVHDKFDNAALRVGTHHDGLDDALHQVKYCVICFNKLAGKTNG